MIYREKTARQYAETHIAKKKIAVIIPTENDGKAIDRWLFGAATSLYWNHIDIFIYDASDDNKTEVFVNNFVFDGFKNIFYRKYSKANAAGNKIEILRCACQELSKEYDYLWIHDSEFLLDIRGIIKKIERSIEKKADMIVVTPAWREAQEVEDKAYTDAAELFKDKCKQLCTLGTVILASPIAKSMAELSVRDDAVETGMWQMESIFKCIAKKSIMVDSYIGIQWNYNFATTEERYANYDPVKLWCRQWYQSIQSLPKEYDVYKRDACKADREDYHPFYIKSLLEARANGTLTIKNVNENRELIPLVCDTSLRKFYLVARTPRFVAKFLTKHDKSKITVLIKGIYYVVCGFVPGEKERLS